MPFMLPRRTLISFCALFLGAQGWLFAAGPGTTAANFLKIPVGARETSLGGAFAAASSGADAVFYNPAGLGLAAETELSYSYNGYLPGISQHWLGAVLPGRSGGWGLGLNYLNVAAFDAYDNLDNPIGSVSAYDLAAYLGYGRGFHTGLDFMPYAGFGAAAKYITEKLDDRAASGYAADAGLLVLTGVKNLRLGLGAENIVSSRMGFISGGDKPALKWKTGASYSLVPEGSQLSFLASFDVNFPEDGPSYVAAGIENTLYGLLSLRAGYSSFGDISSGLTFGLGLALPARAGRRLSVDYSYGSTYDLGNMHRFGLSCRFGEPAGRAKTPKAQPAAEKPQEQPAVAPVSDFNKQLDLLYGGDPVTSREAAEALGKTADPRVMEHFMALLSSGKAQWRLTAVYGLEFTADTRAGEALYKVLNNPDPVMRREAALAIGRRGGEGAAGYLQKALKSEESETVKNAIMEALGKLAGGGN